jgi:hypothetical protein
VSGRDEALWQPLLKSFAKTRDSRAQSSRGATSKPFTLYTAFDGNTSTQMSSELPKYEQSAGVSSAQEDDEFRCCFLLQGDAHARRRVVIPW